MNVIICSRSREAGHVVRVTSPDEMRDRRIRLDRRRVNRATIYARRLARGPAATEMTAEIYRTGMKYSWALDLLAARRRRLYSSAIARSPHGLI